MELVSNADIISDLPDSILCHILSFLPTKLAATTSVLSKRWKSVWISVLAINFEDETFKDSNSFRKFVFSALFSLRDQKASIHSFTLKFGQSFRCFKQYEFNQILKYAMERGVENLNFDMSGKNRLITLPPRILSFKTLQVLKLSHIRMRDYDHVDLPHLKTLYLDRIYIISLDYLVKFLFGCPILEDLHKKKILYPSLVPVENLNALPNLVKVSICHDMDTLMTLVCKAKIMHVEKMSISRTRLTVFHNLTHMELSVHDKFCNKRCTRLLGILPHFPKLEHYIIQDCGNAENSCYNCWKHPITVPECISSRLKTCCIRGYRGTRHQFKFAKYIMQNANVLETMAIKSMCRVNFQKLLELSSITRGSTSFKLFD
ncbi:F-box/RNI/FBD-like domain protein [Medicago truncatula]|uniref:F-box/RNI/FBD-like domain protein n=2 Tax=Medicago truncatula TaxID=3880 RepID=G7IWD4_MEDTR|nr:F-box/RNI/FBD-like domain protein [Medicago truncatula]